MPKMVTIDASPLFDKKSDRDYVLIKKAGPKTVSYQTAIENIRLSGGRFAIVPEDKKPTRINTELSDMSPNDLKVMMLSLGIKTEKKMKRSDVISLIKKKMDEVDIFDEDDQE